MKNLLILQLFLISFGQILFPDSFKGSYLHDTLSNGLEYLVIHCKACSKGAASLTISVGSQQDTLPGLSHLLEHMLFYSSVSFPSPNYLMDFIALNNGYINAYTEFEHTNFYYSLHNSALKRSLKILSSAMLEPILSTSSILSEIKSVNSEHLTNIYTDDWRYFRILQLLGKQNGIGRFNTGNNESLAVDEIESKLKAHFHRYYVAANMKLVVYGDFSVKEMKSWVLKYFGKINKGFENKDHYDDFSELNRIAFITREMKGTKIVMKWKIPSEFKQIMALPGDFVAYLLKAGLRKIPEIEKLEVGVYEHYSGFSLFTAEAELESANMYLQVASDIAGSALKLLRCSESEIKELWEDYQFISSVEFKFSDMIDEEEIASRMSSNMLYLPLEHIYSQFSVKTMFDYSKINNVLKIITYGSPLVILSSSSFTPGYKLGNFALSLNSYCPIYRMKYEFLKLSIRPSLFPLFSLFSHNPFIPKSLGPVLMHKSPTTQLNFSNPSVVYYKPSDRFNIPKVSIGVIFRIDNFSQFDTNFEVVTSMAEQYIMEEMYLYKLAGFEAEFDVGIEGLSVIVKGWNKGVIEFLQRVIDALKTVQVKYFKKAKEAVRRKYESFGNEQPYVQAAKYLNEKVNGEKTANEKLKDLKKMDRLIGLADVDVAVNALVYGNIRKKEITIKEITKDLSIVADKSSEKKIILSQKKPTEYKYGSVNNNCLYNFYTIGKFNLKTWGIILIIEQLYSQEAFNVLRTNDQLGYIVYMASSWRYRSNSLKLIIQGNDFDPDYMQSRVKNFWASIKTDKELFIAGKKSVLQSLELHPNSFSDEFMELWLEIKYERFKFEITKDLVEILKINIKYTDFLEVIRKIRSGGYVQSFKIYQDYYIELINNSV